MSCLLAEVSSFPVHLIQTEGCANHLPPEDRESSVSVATQRCSSSISSITTKTSSLLRLPNKECGYRTQGAPPETDFTDMRMSRTRFSTGTGVREPLAAHPWGCSTTRFTSCSLCASRVNRHHSQSPLPLRSLPSASTSCHAHARAFAVGYSDPNIWLGQS